MSGKIKLKKSSTARVRLKSSRTQRVDPEEVREQLGADSVAVVSDGGSPFSMAAVRRAVLGSLTSTGGRPSLGGSDRRPKIPMSDEDWQTLQECASTMAESGRAVTAGQVAAQLLRDAIAALRGAADDRYAKRPAPSLRFSENRNEFGSHAEPMAQHFEAIAKSFERLAEAVARGSTEAMERHDEIIERLDRLIDRARRPGPRRRSGE